MQQSLRLDAAKDDTPLARIQMIYTAILGEEGYDDDARTQKAGKSNTVNLLHGMEKKIAFVSCFHDSRSLLFSMSLEPFP